MLNPKSEIEFVKEGMAVYDANGDHVGDVKAIRMSDEDPNQPGAETASVQEDDTRNSLVENFAEALTTDNSDDLPEDLRSRLKHKGYIRIDQGILKPDAYAMSDDIVSVSEEEVRLRVLGDQLLNY